MLSFLPNADIKVALSLRDRKAECFLDVARALSLQPPSRLLFTLGSPVAERQDYFRRAISAALFEDVGFAEVGWKAIRKRNSKKELFEDVVQAVAP